MSVLPWILVGLAAARMVGGEIRAATGESSGASNTGSVRFASDSSTVVQYIGFKSKPLCEYTFNVREERGTTRVHALHRK